MAGFHVFLGKFSLKPASIFHFGSSLEKERAQCPMILLQNFKLKARYGSLIHVDPQIMGLGCGR